MLCFGVCGRGEVEDTKGGGGRDGVRTGSSSDRRRRLCRLACLAFFYIKVHKRMLTKSRIHVKSREISTCDLYDTN